LKLRFTPRATENIATIATYIRERNPGAALRVRAAIYDGLQHVLVHPRIGRLQKEAGVRKFVTTRYRYLIYMIDDVEDEIIVLAVKHSAQEPEFGDF
jgi:toxin ParE1/3/4